MPSLASSIAGYFVLAIAACAMAAGAAGIFGARLRSVVVYSAVLQGGYAALGLAAGLLTGDRTGQTAAVFQAIAGAAGIALMWISVRALAAAGESLPLPEGAAAPAWAVFSFVLSCMSLVGLPPLAGLPAKVAVIRAGLHEPGVLFLATLGAAALGAVSLWAYSGIALRLIGGPIRTEAAGASPRLRVAVDALAAVLIGLGVAPYIGFAVAAALTGGR